FLMSLRVLDWPVPGVVVRLIGLVGAPKTSRMRPGSLIDPFTRPWLKLASALVTRVSNSSRNSLRGVAGVGSRRAQKRGMKAAASASVCNAFQAAFSSAVMIHCTGPLPQSALAGESAANVLVATAAARVTAINKL